MSDDDNMNPFEYVLPDFAPAEANVVQPKMAVRLLSSTAAPLRTMASSVTPTKGQQAVKPGDVALLAMSSAAINEDLCAVRILDPEEHKNEFPHPRDDSWVLGTWTSSDQGSIGIGWFERPRLIPLTEEQYSEVITLMETFGDIELPTWVHDLYRKEIHELNETSPDQVARLVPCGNCGAHEVELHAVRAQRARMQVGIQAFDGVEHFVNIEAPETSTQISYHLHCGECGARAAVEDDEVHIHKV